MTDRERLIGLLAYCRIVEGYETALVTKEADHLLEHGVIVLPCKVGDTVYFLDFENKVIRNLKVIEIKLTAPEAMLLYLSDGYLHGAYDYGTSLFKTREEAEKALLERSVDNATQQPYTK